MRIFNRYVVEDIIFTNLMSYVVNTYLNIDLYDINAQPKFFYRDFLDNVKNPPHDFNFDLFILISMFFCIFI